MDKINLGMNDAKEAIEWIFKEIGMAIITRKINEGEELTEDETKDFLQYIYDKANNHKKTIKDIPKLEFCRFKLVTLVGRIAGESLKGIVEASSGVSDMRKNVLSNSNEVLKGVRITSGNQTLENIKTLMTQYEASTDYIKSGLEVLTELRERRISYDPDFTTPIAEEAQEKMQKAKIQVKTLSKQYQRKS